MRFEADPAQPSDVYHVRLRGCAATVDFLQISAERNGLQFFPKVKVGPFATL